ncbi:MAG: FAD-binding oxidoreductase [Candidatus Lokiarchaeota archaeon]|nr:FAD-binding oxidoreductase [Candidatus Lokiarchaeota archaeon]
MVYTRAAKEFLEGIVGTENVITDISELLIYGNPDCIVKVSSIEQIQQVLEVANEQDIGIIPKSSRINLTQGTTTEQGGIILDMSNMNKIINIVGGSDRYATIEPGVTFYQLQEALKKEGLRCMVPLGVPSSASIISTYLERYPLLSGPMVILSEGWQVIFDMLVILADGSTLHTGSGEVIPDKLSIAHFGPAGPDWSRVFTGAQGTMGIVAEMSIKLKHNPPLQKILLKSVANYEELVDLFMNIKRIEIGKECLAISSLNLAAMLAENLEDLLDLNEKLPPWTLVLNLTGWEEEEILVFEEELDELGIKFNTGVYPVITEMSNIEEILKQELLIPDKLMNYRKYKINCTLISYYANLDVINDIIDSVIAIARDYGYPEEDLFGYTMPIEQARLIYSEFTLYHDDSELDLKRTNDELLLKISEEILNFGGIIDRPNGSLASIIYSRIPQYHEYLEMVKNMLDPNNILNPGKLDL